MLLTATKVALPIPTQIVLGTSEFFKSTWYFWFGGILIAPILVGFLRRFWAEFDVWYDRARFHVPMFGSLIHMLTISRFARSLSVLYRAGIPIMQSLRLCEGLVGSPLFARIIRTVGTEIESGENLSDAMRHHPEFPKLLLRLVVTGEKTGNLDMALDNTADYYNLIIPRKIKKIFSIIEPSLIIFLVAIVGFVAMAIFLPILSLMENIR
jgi:type II secretory pathway component PulF